MNAKVSFGGKLSFRYRSLEHKINQYRNNTGETIVTETDHGKIKGAKRRSLYDKLYYSFEKIPYAEPPVGNLRFKAPQPPKPWNDTLDCTQMNPKPMQSHIILDYVDGTEDCLYLNVYTNDLQPSKPRPVMVWIYGGAFILGEANRDWYAPDLLMQKDVVLVTINYRVNVFGFLSLEDPELGVPGNAGLKDQVLALKWIKNNCARFGGNPDNITVFGESAGGASTHYMCLTEKTKGLFHKAIMMSGNALAPWAIVKKSDYAYRLAKHCGYTGANVDKDVLEYLQKAKAGNLVVDDTKLLTMEEQINGVFFCFGPIVEPYISEDCVVLKEPLKMMESAWSNNIPVMTGFTSSEGLLFHPALSKDPNALRGLETCAYMVPTELVDTRDSEKCLELGKKIKEAHVSKDSSQQLNSLLDILGFKHFVHPVHQFLQARSRFSSAPTYLYRFDFETENLYLPFRLIMDKGVTGVGHGYELCYLFHSITGKKFDKNSKEFKTIDRMTSIFSQFATASNPNCDITESLKWDPLHKDDRKCLNISDDLKIMELPEMDKLKVWDSLYTQ